MLLFLPESATTAAVPQDERRTLSVEARNALPVPPDRFTMSDMFYIISVDYTYLERQDKIILTVDEDSSFVRTDIDVQRI